MSPDRLRDALRETPTDPGARARALRVVLEAYREDAGRPAVRAGRRPVRIAVALAACLLVALVGVAAVSAPGDAVARWVRDVLGVGREDARPALVRVPGGGRLLASGGDSAWVVAADGSRRRLGAYAGASWSPHGRFAVVWRGRQLRAVEPGGAVRWGVAARRPVRVARWAPGDGFRIAYVAGSTLRVVNGDGTGDRAHGRARRRVAPAWRPDDRHVLAYADARSRVRVVAVDSGRELWRTPPVAGVRALEWSPGGRRLLVATAGELRLYDRRGRREAPGLRPEGEQRRAGAITDVAWAPGGERIAIVWRGAGASAVLLVDPDGAEPRRRLFGGPGRLGPVAWSPSGRRLLVPWPEADQWLFLSARRGGGRIAAVGNIAAQFAPGPGGGEFPERVEWCCAQRSTG